MTTITPCLVTDVPWQAFASGSDYATRFQDLAAHVGASRISVSHEILEPGKTGTGSHYHTMNEEHVLILEGEAVLLLGDKRMDLVAGSYVCFPAGERQGHALRNESVRPCRYLAIGCPHPSDLVIFPDENRVVVKALQASFPLDSELSSWNHLLNAGGTRPAEKLGAPTTIDLPIRQSGGDD